MAIEFSKNFEGTKVKVGDAQLQIDDCLPQLGDKWFKNMKVKNISWQSLLASKHS